MPRMMLLSMLTAAFALVGTAPASAFLPGQAPLIAAAQDLAVVLEVKRKKAKFKKWNKAKLKKIPPGWSRGRKTGWGSGSIPPGLR